MNNIALSVAAALVLTPIFARALVRGFPGRANTVNEYESFRQKYDWLEIASKFAAITGGWAAVALAIVLHPGNTPWILGLVFGWLVLFPVLLIAVFTLPHGIGRWSEFWRFYEIKYRVSLSFIAPLYIGLCLLGIASTVVLLCR